MMPIARLPSTGLWQHADFLRLWSGQTVSQFGSQVTQLALPLTAAITLQATALQMGILGAAEFAPFLLFGLFAGVWADRRPRRRILVAADLGRALLLGLIPLAALFDVLRIELLYAVGFLAGILTVFFDVAYQSYLPLLVERAQLVEGNTKLEVSRSVAQVAGPGLGGALVQLLTAPVAIAVDALSFLASAAFLATIRRAEPHPRGGPRPGVWSDIGAGVGVVFGNPLLRAIAGCTATSNLFSNVGMAVYVLYVTRELGVTPSLLGVVFAVGSGGALVGALLAGRIARRFGLGSTIVGSALLFPLGSLMVVAAGGPPLVVAAILVAGQAAQTFCSPVYNVNQVSLRQAITPDRLQGRMNATMRFVVWGTIPIGSLAGGFLGDAIGLRPTLLVGALGSGLSFLWVLLSPVRALRDQPVPVEPTRVQPA
jgi:MFS family permease